MVIQTTDIIVPIPMPKTFKPYVYLNSTDVTARVVESEWMRPCTIGLGYFKATLSNANGQLSGSYKAGDVAKFYCDNLYGATLQFWGRIDYVKDKIEKGGQYLELEGRHRSYQATEILVCYEGTQDHGEIIKDLVDTYLPGFTYVNVANTGINVSVRWLYKPLWDCIRELCTDSGFDAYIDDDLDIHFFQANSIRNDFDAISWDNFLSNEDVGTDDYYEKTRVTAMGQDDNGVPIIKTAISDTETDTIREIFIKNTSANTEALVQALADSTLLDYINVPKQGKFTTLLLQGIKPGDNIPIALTRQKINGYYKILQYTHKFGMKIGYKTECLIEKEIANTQTILKDRILKENLSQDADNINKLNYSYNFTFADETNISGYSNTQVSDGVLKISPGYASGYMTTLSQTAAKTITKVEVRSVGKDLSSSTYEVTCNDGSTWFTVTKNTLVTVAAGDQGSKIGIRPTLVMDSTNPDPQIDSLAVLYS